MLLSSLEKYLLVLLLVCYSLFIKSLDERITQVVEVSGQQQQKVTGGLNSMLKEFKATLDRIKKENPKKLIFYTRNKPDYGINLKIGPQYWKCGYLS